MNRLVRKAAAMMATLCSTAAMASGDTVLEWNSIMMTTTASQNPIFQARSAAITQLAVFEAVNAIEQDFDPYLGITAPRTASAHAAAAAAAHGVLKSYFPASGAALDAAREVSLARIVDGRAKSEGIAVGEAAAAAMIALRADDGSTPPQFHVPPSTRPGEWQLTPSCPAAGGVLRQWPDVRPFAIETAEQFRAPPPPSLRSWRYVRDYREVLRVGDINSPFRPQDRADVARFYAATSPIAVWNETAAQVAVQQGRSMSENARALALIDMAISDAQVSLFETKYYYNFWRPETAIRAGDADGNPLTRGDPNFVPFVVTPCFPSYVSGHGGSSAAARAVLERLYGERHHFIKLANPAVTGVVLQYDDFRTIHSDIDDARVFGGIHFRFDQEAGGILGRRVGTYVLRNTLRRVHGSRDDD